MEVRHGNNLARVGWKDGLLTVQFKGRPTLYVFSGVEREDCEKILRSIYPDSLFAKLRKKHGWPCKKLEG